MTRVALAPQRRLPCTVEAADIYTLTTLEADLSGDERVDVTLTTPMGTRRMVDVPFDRDRGLVRYVSGADFLRSLPSMPIRLELVAPSADGERTLGEYFLDHTAFAGT